MRKTLSEAGEPQYGLACTAHGRFTLWYLDADDARYAPVVSKPKRHDPPQPRGTRPPLPGESNNETEEPVSMAQLMQRGGIAEGPSRAK